MGAYDSLIIKGVKEKPKVIKKTILKKIETLPGAEVTDFYRTRIIGAMETPPQYKYSTNDAHTIGLINSWNLFSETLTSLLQSKPSSYTAHAAERFKNTTGAIVLPSGLSRDKREEYDRWTPLGERNAGERYKVYTMSVPIKEQDAMHGYT